MLGWSDGGIVAMIVAAGYPDRINNLVIWGANAFVTQEDAELYEKVRDIDNWSDAMRTPFLQVYGEEYFRTQFSQWVDAICTYFKKFNGNVFCLSSTKSINQSINQSSINQSITKALVAELLQG